MLQRCFVLLLTLGAGLFAQTSQTQDPDFAALVKQWTTRPEFLNPQVDHLPKVAGVPSPKDILGYHIGMPKKLTHVADINKYYRALAAATKRVKVFSAGLTDEGRECIVVAISSDENIANLETNRKNLARLADPRGLSAEDAKAVIANSKPVYMFTAGLHSAETGPSEMLMELAYRIAVEDSPLYNKIRSNVVVMIAPVAEPDGRDRYVDWYYRHKLTEETEADRVTGPPYWGKYIFHDNNRDINYSQITMRNWLKFYLDWHPPIMHELHESVPFLYTFSGQAPQNPTLDPILYAELPWFSNFEMTKMIGYGMPGVWTHAFVDMWSPGYLGFMSSNHNGLLRMYETFGNGGANTMMRKVDAGGEGGGGGSQTTREWYRPLPAYKEVLWSMRNNTNYMETGVLAGLELTANFPDTMLENFYRKSRNSVVSGQTEAPYGYVIPAGQADMNRVAFVVNTLRLQGIEVGRSEAEIKVKEGTYPAGSFVVKRDQPYGRLAKILLEKQVFPDPSLRTYDDTGWTMGLMTHTQVEEIADKSLLGVKTQLIDKFTPVGTTTGTGPVLAVLHNGANAMVTLRYRLKNVKFEALDVAWQNLPAGSYIIEATPAVKAEIEKLGLKAVALEKAPDVTKHAVNLPRLAMFTTWGSTQEVGWVRHAFDQFEIPFDLIYKERIKTGNLRAQYDVIVVPNQGRGGAKGIVYDIDSKPGKPLSYTKSASEPSLGAYGESEDITGGMGLAGVQEFEKFVNDGGVLITLGTSSFFPAEFGLARRVDATRTSPAFYAPGPIVEAEILQQTNPIFYGYTAKTIPVRYANGPLLRVSPEDRKYVLMQFPGTEKSVLSGLGRGIAEIRNRPAIVEVPTGTGRILMFATNPCYRWQNTGEFNMLFNSILHYGKK